MTDEPTRADLQESSASIHPAEAYIECCKFDCGKQFQVSSVEEHAQIRKATAVEGKKTPARTQTVNEHYSKECPRRPKKLEAAAKAEKANAEKEAAKAAFDIAQEKLKQDMLKTQQLEQEIRNAKALAKMEKSAKRQQRHANALRIPKTSLRRTTPEKLENLLQTDCSMIAQCVQQMTDNR
jgi:hypothetical protein